MRYEAPVSVEAASTLLSEAQGQSFVLAGGTDLLVRMKGGFVEPDLIVDIKHIAALQEIRFEKDGFVIGAAVPCAALGENAELRKQWPGVVEAANLIGSKQIQGRCTMVGNLCNASPAADSVPALVAAGAKVRIRGSKGTRSAAIEDIPVGPGRTSLAKGEFIEAILLKKRKNRSADAYLRFIPRSEMDIAVVSAGIDLEARQGRYHLRGQDRPWRRCPYGQDCRGSSRCRGWIQARGEGVASLGRCLFRRLPADQRQARHHRISHQGRRCAGAACGADRLSARRRALMPGIHVSTTVNGDRLDFVCEPDETLLDCLRDRLGLTGAKEGCGTGDCGACSVILDGRLVCSCLVLGAESENRDIETVEGLADGDRLHPLQRQFLEHAALQCGICTPGFLMAAKALLDRNPAPSEEEIRFGLAGNLCRCTGYDKIVRAVQDAAKELQGA